MGESFLYPAIWPEGVRTESIGDLREGSQGYCEMLEGEVSPFWDHPPAMMLFSELDSLRVGIGSSQGQANRESMSLWILAVQANEFVGEMEAGLGQDFSKDQLKAITWCFRRIHPKPV